MLAFFIEKVLAQEVNLLQPLAEIEAVPPDTAGFNLYVQTLFPLFLGASVALAVVVFAWGGLEYILSNIPGAKEEGTGRMKSALWGLLIALAAWVILYTINSQINATSLTNI